MLVLYRGSTVYLKCALCTTYMHDDITNLQIILHGNYTILLTALFHWNDQEVFRWYYMIGHNLKKN